MTQVAERLITLRFSCSRGRVFDHLDRLTGTGAGAGAGTGTQISTHRVGERCDTPFHTHIYYVSSVLFLDLLLDRDRTARLLRLLFAVLLSL